MIFARISARDDERWRGAGWNLLVSYVTAAFKGTIYGRVEEWSVSVPNYNNLNEYPVGTACWVNMKVRGHYPASAIFLRTAAGWEVA